MLIEAYKEQWIEDFHTVKKRILETFINLPVSIEHVGSTAVAQLAAKPIIDIDIIIAEDSIFEKVKTALEKIGYYHNGNQGIPGREVFKRAAAGSDTLDSIAHHLYVCPADSEELQKHVLFRDYLIANEAARIQYQHLKYQIAEEAGQDRKKYAQLKEVKASNFINSILEKAMSYQYSSAKQRI